MRLLIEYPKFIAEPHVNLLIEITNAYIMERNAFWESVVIPSTSEIPDEQDAKMIAEMDAHIDNVGKYLANWRK